MKRRILSLVLALAMVLSLGFTAFADGETEAEIVDAAFALEKGASLEGEKTLTGVVSGIVTPYSAQHENVTVNITVKNSAGEDKTIQCYRIKGEDAATVGSGDTITVTGTIKNYNGTIEFDAGSTFVTVSKGEEQAKPETEEEILAAAFALENNTALEGTYSLTGVVTDIPVAYSAAYGNINVNIKVADKTILCYRMTAPSADAIVVGDTIKVTGALKNFRGTVEFDTGCTFEMVTPFAAKYAFKTFAGYAAGDVSIVVRQEGKTTIGDVTGKDYNYYRVILVGADGVVTDVLETLGRAEVAHSEGDGRKDLVEIPEGGYAIGIHNDAIVADGSAYADLFGAKGVKAGDSIVLYHVNLAALATEAAGAALTGASFDLAPIPFPSYPESAWEIFDLSTAATADGVNAGKFQGNDDNAACGNAFSYVYAYDSENFYVAVVTNYDGIGTPEAKGNGVGTNLRMWFRTNDEATVYTHFVDIQFDGDEVPSLFAKKCGDLNANANTVEISTEGIVAEAVSSRGTLFMQAKIPFSVIEAEADFGAFVTVSNGKSGDIVNNCIIAPYNADCTFAKDGMDRTKNNTYFPYTSWNDAALVIPVQVPVEPITEQVVDLGELKIIDVITFTADDPSIGTVKISGSVDGEEFYDLNAGGAAKVNAETGVVSVALTTQGYIQVRYLKVEGTDVHGTLTATYKNADEGAFIAPPAGPYDFGLKDDNAYCIVMLENRVVDINAVKGEDYVVAPKNNQLIITQKVANGVYKIIANSVNAWPNQGHPELITAGIEGLNIDEEGIITLADDQFAFVIVSSGSIKTAGDEQTAPAKRIDRGLGTNGYLRVDGDKLTLHVNQPAAVTVPENVLDLGELKIIDVITFTADDPSIGTVRVYGSVDGEEYYDLNAGGAAKVNAETGVVSVALTTQGYIQVRYIKVVGTDVAGTIEVTFKAADEGAFIAPPAGPYDFGLKDDNAYCIVMLENRVVDINAVKGDDYVVAPKNNQLIITQKVANGVYKIIANSVNAWPNQGHPELITAGIEGLNINEEGIITLADDQFAFVIVSSGSIKTAGDEQTAPAKRIDRGLGTNGYLRVDGDKLTLHVNEPEAVEEIPVVDPLEPEAYLWIKGTNEVQPGINFRVPGELVEEGAITVRALVYFGEDCTGDGSVYLNCYPWDAAGNLLNWRDYASNKACETGKWLEVELADHDPSINGAQPSFFTLGVGFYVATGTIKLGYIQMLQNDEVVWSVSFENGYDLAGAVNITAENKGTVWDVVGAKEPVEAGEYAIKTFTGYASGDVAIFVRQEGKTTLADFTTKDYNAYALIVCDAEGKVIDLDLRGPGRPQGVKGDYEIPEGGFIIAINRDVAGYPTYVGSVEGAEQFMADGVKIGDTIKLYGVDLAALATAEAQAVLEGASFDVIEAAAPVVEPYQATVIVKDNAILTDGKTGFAGAWGTVGTGDVLLVANAECTKAPMVVTIIDELDAVKEIVKISLDLYHDANVMIGYPEGKAEVFVSVDGEDYTSLGEFDLLPARLALGANGTISSAFEFEPTEAKFIKIVLNVGSNAEVLGDTPADGKIYWEFISIAEIIVEEKQIVPGKYTIKSFAGYGTEDVSIVVRQEGKTTIGDVTGKDYNYYRVILVDADGVVTEVLEKLGRAEVAHSEEDGRKDLVEIPEGGFAIGIHNNVIVAEGSVYADLFGENGVKPGDEIELIGIDPADLTETAAQTALEGATFNATIYEVVPEGAYGIDYAQDWMADISVIYTRLTTGEKTLGTVTEVTTGKKQDCTWWNAIVVDGAGKVIQVVGMVDKTDLEIPEGGYLLLAHGESPVRTLLPGILVGSKITLYNVDLAACAKLRSGVALRNAAFTVTEPVIERPLSYQKSYTTTENTRTDAHKDDGVKLTDGKRAANGGGGTYSGWGNRVVEGVTTPTDVEVIVDLEDTYYVKKFVVHAAGGTWGITIIKGFNVAVSIDGETFTAVSGTASVSATEAEGEWKTADYIVELPASVEARYVKFLPIKEDGTQFTWIDEVEVWEGSEPVPTTIDGILNDDIWAAAEWTTYDGYNVGTWQQYQKKGTYTYTTALVEDDEYVYFAGVVSTTGVTQIRTWFRTNPEASLYTHFYDIFPDKDSFIKKNQSLTENSGAVIDGAYLDFKLVEADGKTYVEYKAKKSDLEINGDFEYIPQASVNGFSNLLGAEIVHGNFVYGGKTMTNFPWVNWPKAPEEAYVGLIPVTNHWIFTDIDYGGTVGVISKAHYERMEDGHLRFVVGGTANWPLVTYYYEEAKVYNVERGTLHYSFITDRCNTNITFIFEDANGATYSFPLANTALGLEAGQYDAGSGDIRPGTYEGTIALADLVASKALLGDTAFPEADATELKFTGIIVYACGISDPNGGVYIDDLSVSVVPAPAVTEKVFDLGEVVAITGVTFTADNAEGLETVEILGSADGVNFYRLNSEPAVTVTDGVATLNSLTGANHRMYLNVRYIKVIGEPDVNGTIDIDEVDTGINPEGPYTAVGLEDKGYGIVIWTAEDAPDGFGVNDKGYTSNGKTLNLTSAMITIAEKDGNNLYKILWNDSNGWVAGVGASHANTPEGVEGIDYRDGKVYLKDNQIAVFTMSSGAYEIAGDGEYSNAKWILRGIVSGGYVKLGDGVIYVYSEKPAASELTREDVADFDGDGKVTSDDAVYLLRAVLFPERYAIKVPAPFYGDKTPTSDDAVYLLRAVLFPERYPLLDD